MLLSQEFVGGEGNSIAELEVDHDLKSVFEQKKNPSNEDTRPKCKSVRHVVKEGSPSLHQVGSNNLFEILSFSEARRRRSKMRRWRGCKTFSKFSSVLHSSEVRSTGGFFRVPVTIPINGHEVVRIEGLLRKKHFENPGIQSIPAFAHSWEFHIV